MFTKKRKPRRTTSSNPVKKIPLEEIRIQAQHHSLKMAILLNLGLRLCCMHTKLAIVPVCKRIHKCIYSLKIKVCMTLKKSIQWERKYVNTN